MLHQAQINPYYTSVQLPLVAHRDVLQPEGSLSSEWAPQEKLLWASHIEVFDAGGARIQAWQSCSLLGEDKSSRGELQHNHSNSVVKQYLNTMWFWLV